MRTNVHVYAPADRPDVTVEVDGAWHKGTVRMAWTEDGEWWANVEWTPNGTTGHRLDNFVAGRVRRS